jgi:hypothetical protein
LQAPSSPTGGHLLHIILHLAGKNVGDGRAAEEIALLLVVLLPAAAPCQLPALPL